MTLQNIPCAICEKNETEIIYKKFNLFISRCSNCGLTFANPRLPPEDIAKRYSAGYFGEEYLPSLGVRDGKYSLEFFDRRHAAMLSLIANTSQQPGRLFEAGAGAGFFLKAAERVGWKVSGIEFLAEGAKFARDELALDVKQQLAEEMNLEAECFDVVVIFDVIEHLFDPGRVLASVYRSLRPGGLFVISTPNLNALSKSFLGIDWAVLSPAEHLYYFTETTLTEILKKAGFRKIRFLHQHAGFGTFETMNPRNTHAPRSARAIIYFSLVSLLGPLMFRWVQALGRGDTLLCLAERSW